MVTSVMQPTTGKHFRSENSDSLCNQRAGGARLGVEVEWFVSELDKISAYATWVGFRLPHYHTLQEEKVGERSAKNSLAYALNINAETTSKNCNAIANSSLLLPSRLASFFLLWICVRFCTLVIFS